MGFFQQLRSDVKLYNRVAVDIVQYYCLVKLVQNYLGDLEIVSNGDFPSRARNPATRSLSADAAAMFLTTVLFRIVFPAAVRRAINDADSGQGRVPRVV
jgi:hypothetical protein